MTKLTDPDELSRDERICELARILAKGVIRLLDADSSNQESSAKEPQSCSKEP
jgi:hypothetical protein